MYAPGLPKAPRREEPSAAVVQRALDLLRDADKAPTERIEAAWVLAHANDDSIAAALASVLREPTMWLGSEVLEVLRALDVDDDIAFGVDTRGALTLSPTPKRSRISSGGDDGDVCPVLGAVVPIARLRALRKRLAEPLPWLEHPEHDEVRVMWLPSTAAAPGFEVTTVCTLDVDEDDQQPKSDVVRMHLKSRDGDVRVVVDHEPLVVNGPWAPTPVNALGSVFREPVPRSTPVESATVESATIGLNVAMFPGPVARRFGAEYWVALAVGDVVVLGDGEGGARGRITVLRENHIGVVDCAAGGAHASVCYGVIGKTYWLSGWRIDVDDAGGRQPRFWARRT